MHYINTICLSLYVAFGYSQQSFKVIVYTTPNTAIQEIPFDQVTHINYAFAIPAKTGDTLESLHHTDYIRQLIDTAHQHQVKVFLSIGGWGIGDGGGDDSRFHRMAETPIGRLKFMASSLKMVQEYNFDGIDLDWEYPDPDHRSADDFVLLSRDLHQALRHMGKQLTCAVISHGPTAFGIKEEVYPYMDWINVMAYDGDYLADSIIHHSPYELAEKSIDFWINNRHLPPEKCILGLPFYAKKGLGQYGFGYRKLLDSGADSNADFWNGHFYNGKNTISRKTKLALEKKLGGVMVWELKLDASGEESLIRQIHNAVITFNAVR